MGTTRQGIPGDPMHRALLERHYALCSDERERRGRFTRERRQGDRRKEAGGMAAVAGLNRRKGDRRRGPRRAADTVDRRRELVLA